MSEPLTVTEPCQQILTATDVSIEDADGRREWPSLVSYCSLNDHHVGAHEYGPWIDPRTGTPAYPSEGSSPRHSDGDQGPTSAKP